MPLLKATSPRVSVVEYCAAAQFPPCTHRDTGVNFLKIILVKVLGLR